VSSHILADVEECCEEVLVLKEGRIAVYCNLEEERRADRRFLELETRGGEGNFADAAAALGCEVAPGGKGRIKMILPERVEIPDLYRLAAERGVQIRRLTHRRDSLQDIFLRAMEQPSGDL
jgi:ABC-2 type transport system ATP-binding protein